MTGGAWALGGKVFTALLGLGANALLARLLTPEDLGAYFLIVAVVTASAIFAQLGLTQTIVRFVAESMGTDQPGRARLAVRISLRIASLSAITVAGIIVFGGGRWVAEQIFHSSIMSQAGGLMASWVFLLVFQELIAEVFRGLHDIRLAVIFGGLMTGLLSTLVFLSFWLLRGQSDIQEIMIVTVIAVCSSVILSSFFLRKKLGSFQEQPGNEPRLLDILRVAWPLWITSLVLYLLTQVAVWVMGVFRSPEEVAVYGVAARAVMLIGMPLMIANAVVPPTIAEMNAQRRPRDLESTLRYSASLAGIPALLIFIVFVLFGGAAMRILFGEYYESSGPILFILSVGQLVNVLAGSCGLVLMLTGHQMTMMLITCFSSSITAFAAILSVTTFGGIGVAVAAAGGMMLQNLLMLIYAKKKTDVWTHIGLSLNLETRNG